MSEEYFKIKIEQDVLNNIVDSGKITLDEKYYHKRSIRLMKEAQEWGKQQALKNILELIINFKNKLHKDEYKVWDERRVLSMLEQIEKELGVEKK